MRLVHTADWHLGQLLHGVSRAFEHDRFLAWLVDTLEAREADALIVAGDVFDVASPSAVALQQYYDFLAQVRRRLPDLDVVVVAGNHDSPARIDAPADVLGTIGIHVVGAPHETRKAVPIHAKGEVAGWVLPVPFLRPRDLPAIEEADELGVDRAHGRLIEGHKKLYRELVESVRSIAAPEHAIVATGHCYMAQGIVSELSERKIQVGHQHALPVDVFPRDIGYVALGHLHRAQIVGGREDVRYSGSPIPLSMIERGYEHQVLQIDFDGPRVKSIEPIYVPRAVDLMCLPEEHAPLAEVIEKLRALPREAPDGADDRERPFLEVRVLREGANPRLRRDVEDAIAGAWVRLLRIDAKRPENEAAPEVPRTERLETLSPEDVFFAAYMRARAEPPNDALVQMFLALVEDVERGA
ncbi:MAG: exonuclease SbcCD subunit D C-terminal domain-containing protein [Deltaproteobacteria bacterium]